MDDSGISASISMASMADCARYCAYLRRKTTASCEVGLMSLAQGMRARMAHIASVIGVDGSKPVSNASALF